MDHLTQEAILKPMHRYQTGGRSTEYAIPILDHPLIYSIPKWPGYDEEQTEKWPTSLQFARDLEHGSAFSITDLILEEQHTI